MKFCSIKNAQKKFSKAAHLKNMSQSEIDLRTGKKMSNIYEYYDQAIMDFTQGDIQCLNWYTELVRPYIEKYAPKLVPLLDSTSYIKLREGTEWNFPFTLNDTVVVNEPFLNDAYEGKRTHSDQLVKKTMNVIVHELIHVYQKKYPNAFKSIYSLLGFSEMSILIPDGIKSWMITNPDGENGVWTTGIHSKKTGRVHIFLPALMNLSNYNKKNMKEVLIEVKVVPGSTKMVASDNVLEISDVPSYSRRFGTDKQLYHPNEIVANIIADYVVYAHVKPAQDWTYQNMTKKIVSVLN